MQCFYGCYLLESLKQNYRTYIGFCVDPRRRLRQHNGEIPGGAWKTHRSRPWKMVMCIWGLPNKIAALQFEYAWQHPAVCRHVKKRVAHLGFCHLTKKGRQRVIHGTLNNIKVVFEMLRASPYCQLPLHVHVFDSTAYWELLPKVSAKEHLPKHMKITHGSFDELEHICAEQMQVVDWKVGGSCASCTGPLGVGDRVVLCPGCECSLHVRCAAKAFTGTCGQLMPQSSGACPSCGKMLEWPVLVRSARRLSRRSVKGAETSIHPAPAPSAMIGGPTAPVIVLEEASVAGPQGLLAVRRRNTLRRRTARAAAVRGEVAVSQGAACYDQTVRRADSLRERLLKKRRIDASVLGGTLSSTHVELAASVFDV